MRICLLTIVYQVFHSYGIYVLLALYNVICFVTHSGAVRLGSKQCKTVEEGKLYTQHLYSVNEG